MWEEQLQHRYLDVKLSIIEIGRDGVQLYSLSRNDLCVEVGDGAAKGAGCVRSYIQAQVVYATVRGICMSFGKRWSYAQSYQVVAHTSGPQRVLLQTSNC